MDLEKQYVQQVYSSIADHFNDTRFCIWDFVKKFLTDKTASMKGLDIGCGNGKNMLINSELNIIGCDVCEELLQICRSKGLSVLYGDCYQLNFKNDEFDYAMAIAVFHHMSTFARIHKSLKEMIRVLKSGGKGVFSVWSVENQPKRKFVPGDNFIPWVRHSDKKRFSRYYRVYDKPMITNLIMDFSGQIIIKKLFNEHGNWVVLFEKK